MPKKGHAIVKNPAQPAFQANQPKVANRRLQDWLEDNPAAAAVTSLGNTKKLPVENTTSRRSHSENMLDLAFPDLDASTSLSLSKNQLPELPNMPDVFFHTSSPDLLNTSLVLQGLSQLSAEVNPQPYVQDYGPPIWNTNYFLEDYVSSFPRTAIVRQDPGFVLSTSVEDNSAHPKGFEEGREEIAMFFLSTTCNSLSIEGHSNQNPWRTVIWPMAQQYPALYHALAALTCFHTNKTQYQLRIDGERHLQTSTRLLFECFSRNEMPLEAALAATLALGFAETWDNDSSATGMTHICGAGMLLQQMLSNQDEVVYTPEEQVRLEFLFNTWTYMDVIARFTCLDLCPPVPESLISATVGRLNLSALKLDPLMGYATSFFPTMRRVADLICNIRVKNALRNSPVIISQALELKRNIEDWVPPFDLETVDNHSQVMTDAIQTAEAYRWSILSLLYQAVPELPNQTSYGELAQKTLVYLATIPLSSPTIIIHILPLIIAGNDAVGDEDRGFVRDRWKAMSKRLVTGVVERALEITEEVWKRRDEYWMAHGLSYMPEHMPQTVGISLGNNTNYGTASGAISPNPVDNSVTQARLTSRTLNPFPISAAFKKGVDSITRSGSIDYTVRGHLHWLGVMKDWQWQGKLSREQT